MNDADTREAGRAEGRPGEARVVVITGASAGIGAAAARALRQRGANTVIVGRSAEKTNRIADELESERYVVDFASLSQVAELGRTLVREHPRIDVLVNNAGLITGNTRILTEDRHELTFQVNHLAPFLLTRLLADSLTHPDARIIVTSSAASRSRSARIRLTDLDLSNSFSGLAAYATSKLENVLFVKELARRLTAAGTGANTAAVHPGITRTSWAANGPFAVRAFMASPLRLFARTPERGADTIVWLADQAPGSAWRSGGYYLDRRPVRENPVAADPDLSRHLWERSEELIADFIAPTRTRADD